MRDHELKNEAGRIEDLIIGLATAVEKIAADALYQGAEEHAEFYDDIACKLRDAERAMVGAYTLLLNGDGLNIEALVDA